MSETNQDKKPWVTVDPNKLIQAIGEVMSMAFIAVVYGFVLRFTLDGFGYPVRYWPCVGALYLLLWISPKRKGEGK